MSPSAVFPFRASHGSLLGHGEDRIVCFRSKTNLDRCAVYTPQLHDGCDFIFAPLKSMEFNSEQQLQDVMSSELGMGTSPQCLEFNPGPQLQDIKSSEVCTETKLPDEPSPEFKHKPTLQDRASCDPSTGPQIHCKNVMASNTRTQNVELSELHPGPDLQGIKSKVFCLGQHLEDVNSACIPNANSQYINSSGYNSYIEDLAI